MADKDTLKDVSQDNVEQGLSLSDKTKIKIIARQVVQTIALQTDDPRIAFVVLLNVMASLIGTIFPQKERRDRTERVLYLLPLYVHAYETKEKKLS